jgi:hypothetical protein
LCIALGFVTKRIPVQNAAISCGIYGEEKSALEISSLLIPVLNFQYKFYITISDFKNLVNGTASLNKYE